MPAVLGILFLAVIFYLSVENVGWLVRRLIIGKIPLSSEERDFPSVVPNVFVGLLGYAMMFFVIGVLRIMSPELVLWLTVIPIGLIAFRLAEYIHYGRLLWKNKFIVLGVLVFLYMARNATHRPILQFDGLWYHLPIPKNFLQQGHIGFNGDRLRYSVHPFLNFFWNLYPLSLPLSIPYAGLVINWVQTIMMALAGFFAAWTGKRYFNFNLLFQLATPILLGFTTQGIYWMGSGYNDLHGYAVGLVVTLYVFHTLKKPEITWDGIVTTVLLITCLGLIKIFFAVYAVFLLLFFLVSLWERYGFSSWFRRSIYVVIGCGLVFVLPWLIRAYYYTGYPLYPVGTDWINRDAYRNVGADTEFNFYYNFVWDRFYLEIPKLLVHYFTPLLLVGVVGITVLKKYALLSKIWFVSVLALIITMFASIVFGIRYFWAPIGVLIFLGIVTLNNVSKKGGLFVAITILLIPLSFLSFANRYAWSIPDNVGRNFLGGPRSVDKYLEDRMIHHLGYYNSEVTRTPEDLSDQDAVYVTGFPFTAYIENPIYNWKDTPNEFEDLQTVSEFKNRLQDLDVKYILARRYQLNDDCKRIGIANGDECHSAFKILMFDKKHGAYWYQVSD